MHIHISIVLRFNTESNRGEKKREIHSDMQPNTCFTEEFDLTRIDLSFPTIAVPAGDIYVATEWISRKNASGKATSRSRDALSPPAHREICARNIFFFPLPFSRGRGKEGGREAPATRGEVTLRIVGLI